MNEDVGKLFGKRTVLSVSYDKKKRKTLYFCRCECGSEKNVPAYMLKAGKRTMCELCALKKNREARILKRFGKKNVEEL